MTRKFKAPQKPASIRMVSDALGMNQSTVSRILNRKGGYSYDKETVHRVCEKARELGYRPNRLVQGVIDGKSMTIGVVIRLGPFYNDVIIGVHDALSARGYLPVLGCSKIDIAKGAVLGEHEIFNTLLDHRVDGIIFRTVNEDTTREYFQEAYDRGIPMVAVDRALTNIKMDLVTSDDEAGGAEAARHLLDLNHRVIAVPSNEPPVSSYDNRLRSFMACVQASGGELISVDYHSVKALTSAMASGTKRPTAFFAVDDRRIRNIYLAAQRSGLNIPKELSVIGYGNLAEGQTLIPGATTMDQDPYAIGTLAAELVLARIAAPDKPFEHVKMPVKLVKRGSTQVLRS